MIYQYTDFGKEVKILMIKLNLTSRELAHILGYSESTLCDILKGRNRNTQRKIEIYQFLSQMNEENNIISLEEFKNR